VRHWQKVLGCSLLITLLCCVRGFSLGVLFDFRINRIYFYNQEPPIYLDRGDFSNQPIAPYTVGDSIFVLSVYPHSTVYGDHIKNGMANASYSFIVFTKKRSDSSYRIKNISIITSEYQGNIETLIYAIKPYSGPPEPTGRYGTQLEFREWEKNRDYRRSMFLGGYFAYPRPKDMKIIFDVEVEVSDANVISTHVFRYHYSITQRNRWIDLYGV